MKIRKKTLLGCLVVCLEVGRPVCSSLIVWVVGGHFAVMRRSLLRIFPLSSKSEIIAALMKFIPDRDLHHTLLSKSAWVEGLGGGRFGCSNIWMNYNDPTLTSPKRMVGKADYLSIQTDFLFAALPLLRPPRRHLF